jgi:hypothetical protein
VVDLHEQRYQCGFCGNTIERTRVDPCAMVVAARWSEAGFDGRTQQIWFHAGCLRQHLHPTVPVLPGFVEDA